MSRKNKCLRIGKFIEIESLCKIRIPPSDGKKLFARSKHFLNLGIFEFTELRILVFDNDIAWCIF